MIKFKKFLIIAFIFIVDLIILLSIVLFAKFIINYYNKKVCYNLPLNQFAEDSRCSSYNIEDYIKGGDFDVSR